MQRIGLSQFAVYPLFGYFAGGTANAVRRTCSGPAKGVTLSLCRKRLFRYGSAALTAESIHVPGRFQCPNPGSIAPNAKVETWSGCRAKASCNRRFFRSSASFRGSATTAEYAAPCACAPKSSTRCKSTILPLDKSGFRRGASGRCIQGEKSCGTICGFESAQLQPYRSATGRVRL